MIFGRAKTEMVTPERALAGSADYDYSVPTSHYVNGHPLQPPFPAGLQSVVVGMGCFWGAEKGFWQTEGVYTTAAGYAGGYTPHPSYEQTCTGLTGHTEVVLVVFDPAVLSFEQLLQHFFESHDPTQGNRQGNDVGSQYRSAIYYSSDEQRQSAEKAKATYGRLLAERGFGPVTTEIAPLGEFYYAEGYHQQYLAKNPHGYCPDHGTGVSCPVGLFGTAAEITAAD